MITLWKPTPTKDAMPDVHDAAKKSVQNRCLRFEKELTRFQQQILSITTVAIQDGKFRANNSMFCNRYLPETIIAAQKWLHEKGYEVWREYHRCTCDSHLYWSWENKFKNDAGSVELGTVERLLSNGEPNQWK